MEHLKSSHPRAAALIGALCFILMLMGLSLTPTASAHAATTITADNIVYTLDVPAAGQATVTDYAGNGGAVTIPDTVTDVSTVYTVTTISDNAFFANQLNSVTIPNTVTTIGQNAFSYNQLTSVTIPNSVTTIGAIAFYANQLNSVTIPNSVTTIGDYAFRDNQLTSVTIPNNVTTIGNYAFANNHLTSVTISNGVTRIGFYAFSSNQLTSVTIPNSITTIGNGAFSSNQLTSVTIPNSITTIGENAFYINLLTSVTIPNSVTTIGAGAFFDNQLTSVTIPNSVTAIGGAAFQGNDNLSSVRFMGNAPTTFTPTTDMYPSLGTNPALPIQYSCGATGFTTPIWQGYTNVTPTNCVVNFDAQGGNTIPAQNVDYGATVNTPPIPTRAGYTFTGWYTTLPTPAQPQTPYDFSTIVTGPLTLHAGWEAHAPVVPPAPEAPAASPATPHTAHVLANTGATHTAPIPGLACASLLAAALLLTVQRRITQK